MGQRGRPRHPDLLTPREQDVLVLLRDNLTNEQIADRLGISFETAKHHVGEILSKLGVSTREEAAAWRDAPEWSVGRIALAIAGTAIVAAAVGGLALLAWGLSKSGDGDDTVSNMSPRPTLTSLPSPATFPAPTSCEDFGQDMFKVDLSNGEVTTIGRGVSPQWSPDGANIAYGVPPNLSGPPYCDEGLIVQRVESNEPFFALPRFGGWHWSPDGHMIAVGGNGFADDYVTLISGIGDHDISTAEIYHGRVGPIAWSPDGTLLAFVDGDTTEIHMYDVATEQTSTFPSLLDDIPGYVAEIAWSPTGDRLAAVPYELVTGGPNILHLYVVTILGGSSHEVPSAETILGVQWTSDGAWLLFSDSTTRTIYRVSADGSTSPEKLADGGGGLLSPDGSLIAFVTGPCGEVDIAVAAADGGEQRIVAPGGWAFRWAPNSASIAVYSDATYIVAADGTGLTRVADHLALTSWSPDGRYLAGGEILGIGVVAPCA